MAVISPFRSVQYNPGTAGNLGQLITPPYDVISPEQQEAYYRANDFNIIRLVLGRQFPDDSPGNNRYTRAAATLKEWLAHGVLVRQDRPSMVIYQMEFQLPDGGSRTMDGLVVLVRVENYGGKTVLPHEKTYKGPRKDQLNLLKACHAHFTPIHALFNDRDNLVMEEYGRFMSGPPEQEARDENGTIHRTWAFSDEGAMRRIAGLLKDNSLFIGDGHHRYETALEYRDEIRNENPPPDLQGHEYVMMYITSTSHPGLTILPAHRMIKGIPEDNLRNVLEKLEPYFELEPCGFCCSSDQAAATNMIRSISNGSGPAGNFGMVLNKGKGCKVLRLKSFQAIDHLIDPSVPRALRDFDVTILRHVVVGYGLGLNADDPEGFIEYTPSVAEALRRVQDGETQVSFILNPTRVEQVQTAAELGYKLPHKSTYFYPKLASGLVLNCF